MRTSVDVDALATTATALQSLAEVLATARLEAAGAAEELRTGAGRRGPVPVAADVLAAATGRHLAGAATRAAELAGRVRAGAVTYREVDAAVVPVPPVVP